MAAKPRILFVLSELPYPVHRNGIALINHELLRSMDPTWTVDIVADEGSPFEAEALRQMMPWVDGIHLLDSERQGRSPAFGHFGGIIREAISLGERGRIEAIAKAKSYDMIYASPLTMAPRVVELSPVFLNAVDSYSLLNERFHAASGRLGHLVRARFYDWFEAHYLRRMAAVNFVSDVDAERVRGRTGLSTIGAIPNGVDVDRFSDRGLERTPKLLLMTGLYSYQPNRSAVAHMVDAILPRLRERDDFRLQIVGRDPPTEHAGKPGVEILGFVDDIADSYNRCSIFVCPLLSGAGIKNKVLEAMACGAAVVSTSIGVDGIRGIEPGVNILVADGPDAFAQAVIQLHENVALRDRLGTAAAQLIRAQHRWTAAARMYHARFEAVMDRRNLGRVPSP